MPRGVYERKKANEIITKPKKKAKEISIQETVIKPKAVEWKIDSNIPLPPVRPKTLADKYPTLYKLKPGQSSYLGNIEKTELDKIMTAAQRRGKEENLVFYYRTRTKEEHNEQGYRLWCLKPTDVQRPRFRRAVSNPVQEALTESEAQM